MKLLITRRDGVDIDRAIVVTCKSTSSIRTAADLKTALVSACSKWMQQTKEGMDAWEYSSMDFNFGDLVVNMHGSLPGFIANEGIEDFSIDDTAEPCSEMSYDTVLMSSVEES